jgi:hypothetical protein
MVRTPTPLSVLLLPPEMLAACYPMEPGVIRQAITLRCGARSPAPDGKPTAMQPRHPRGAGRLPRHGVSPGRARLPMGRWR